MCVVRLPRFSSLQSLHVPQPHPSPNHSPYRAIVPFWDILYLFLSFSVPLPIPTSEEISWSHPGTLEQNSSKLSCEPSCSTHTHLLLCNRNNSSSFYFLYRALHKIFRRDKNTWFTTLLMGLPVKKRGVYSTAPHDVKSGTEEQHHV